MSTLALKRDSKIAKAGGSDIIRIPKTFSEILGFKSGVDIEMFTDGETLTIRPKAEDVTLESILAASSADAFRITEEDSAWLNMRSAGAEV